MSKVAVWFNEPICSVIEPPVPPGRPEKYSHEQIQTMIKNLREDGFDSRAVVCLANKYAYWYQEPKNWGIVMDLKSFHAYNDPNPYKPIAVRWVDGPAGVIMYWPEELILIHKTISIRAVHAIADSQE